MSLRRRRSKLAAVVIALAVVLGLALLSRGSRSSAGTLSKAAPSSASSASLPAGQQPIIYVPPSLPAGKVPLLIVLDGNGGTPLGMESATAFDAVARTHGFVVAYLHSYRPGFSWRAAAETDYIGSMIDQLEAAQPIDPARVYVTGFSAGGYESYRAGCQLSKKVAAIAPVAVSMSAALRATCKLSRPVSVLIILGSADTVHYAHHLVSAATWRTLDGCPAEQPRTSVAPGPTDEQLWTGCADGSDVGLNVVQGGTHIYPGPRLGASPDGQYDASAAIWAFLASHRAGSLKTPDARLSSLRVGVVGRTREVVLKLRLGEPVSAREVLSQHGSTVASKHGALGPGRGIRVVLPVSRAVAAGRYSVSLVLKDSYGRRLTLVRAIRLGSNPA